MSTATCNRTWNSCFEDVLLVVSCQIASSVISTCFSITELEKLSLLALNGTEEERTVASKILCGASLTCGWNIQVKRICYTICFMIIIMFLLSYLFP